MYHPAAPHAPRIPVTSAANGRGDARSHVYLPRAAAAACWQGAPHDAGGTSVRLIRAGTGAGRGCALLFFAAVRGGRDARASCAPARRRAHAHSSPLCTSPGITTQRRRMKRASSAFTGRTASAMRISVAAAPPHHGDARRAPQAYPAQIRAARTFPAVACSRAYDPAAAHPTRSGLRRCTPEISRAALAHARELGGGSLGGAIFGTGARKRGEAEKQRSMPLAAVGAPRRAAPHRRSPAARAYLPGVSKLATRDDARHPAPPAVQRKLAPAHMQTGKRCGCAYVYVRRRLTLTRPRRYT